MKGIKYKYRFSVVIPIFNVEEFLEETIESVINQDLGFEENIQLILVNDGSPDNSEEICLKYKEMYPNNVIYVKQENAGVSAARNKGMEYAEGKYLNFLDADDKWDLDAFRIALEFFEKNKKKIDFVSCRMKFFEAKEDYHILDYKFDSDKVVNVMNSYDHIQLTNSATFSKTRVMKKFKYDEGLKYFEDAEVISEMLLKNPNYGILRSAVYNVRKRANTESATQNQRYTREYYFDTIEKAHKTIFELSKEKYGFVLPYFQYLIMYDLAWRLKLSDTYVLDETELQEYYYNVKKLLQDIEDYIIIEQKCMYHEHKKLALSIKYGKDITNEYEYRNCELFYKNIKMMSLKGLNFFVINIFEVEKNMLHIEGYINDILDRNIYNIKFVDNNKNEYDLEYFDVEYTQEKTFNGQVFHQRLGYRVDIPLKNVKKIKPVIKYKDIYECTLMIKFSRQSHINSKSQDYYLKKGKYIFKTKNQNQILIKKNENGQARECEKEYIKYLKSIKRKDIAKFRKWYRIYRKFNKKHIWIVSDRATNANDNGIQLFKYLMKHEKNAKVYFAINSKCPDYKKVKKIGPVLKINSRKYKMMFLLSNIIISSQTSDFVTNPFGEDEHLMFNLYNNKFVFLQHGITKDDISSWAHKNLKNIKLFITAGNEEYNSILNGSYGYTDKEVKLTGFPRFDALKNNRKNYITIMPTWRKKLASQVNKETDERIYNENFKESEYFKFYNNLISDERILQCAKENNYKIRFCMHPNHKQQYKDFDINECVEILHDDIDYSKEFSEAALLVSDYSSTPFDFAYLNKPVIYTQFDREDFFENHTYQEGYFDYEEDGFGPVCYDYETTVEEIIKMIENDCKIDKKYQDRINKFFEYHDKNNCKRVHEEILKL